MEKLFAHVDALRTTQGGQLVLGLFIGCLVFMVIKSFFVVPGRGSGNSGGDAPSSYDGDGGGGCGGDGGD